MLPMTEQLSRAARALAEAQVSSVTAFAQVALDSGAGAAELNMDALKTALAASTVTLRQLMTAKDTQEWFGLASSQPQQAFERLQAYGRQMAEVAQGARAALTRVAETEAAAARQKAGELVEAVGKAPAFASTPMNSFLKTAIDNAHAGYDQMTRAGQQQLTPPAGVAVAAAEPQAAG